MPSRNTLLLVASVLFISILSNLPIASAQRTNLPAYKVGPIISPDTLNAQHSPNKVIPGQYIVVYKEQSASSLRLITVPDIKERNKLMRENIQSTLQRHRLTQKPVLHVYDTAIKGFAIAGLSEHEVAQIRNDEQVASIEPDYSISIDLPHIQATPAEDSPACTIPSSITIYHYDNKNPFNFTSVTLAKFGGRQNVTGEVVVVSGTACAPLDGVNLTGKIAIINRGSCDFSTKAYQAQQAGAAGVIIVNNTAGTTIGEMASGVDGHLVTIPTLMISQNNGNSLRNYIFAYGMATMIMNVNPLANQQCVPWGITRVNGGVSGVGKRAWVIDTGIDMDHPDLNVNTTLSANFVTGETSPEDYNGHGTHVAGTIAAIDNGFGVVGVAAGAEVVGVRVIGLSNYGSTSDIIAGINYVTSQVKAEDVVNMSIGGYSVPSAAMRAAIVALTAKAPFTLSAGNAAINTSFYNYARIKTPNLYVVSSITKNDDSYSSFSNYGNSVRYAAPGSDVLSSIPNGGYGYMSGTSMAAPHIAGMLLVGNLYVSGHAQNDPDGRPDPIPALNCIENNVDADGDNFTVCQGDVDDNDPTVYPGAPELCDNKDNDGNGLIDEGGVCCPTWSGNILYVKEGANSGGDGSSWNDAFSELSDALHLARKCTRITQVWIANGTYYPTTDELGIIPPFDPRMRTFTLRDNLTIYGNLVGNEPADYDMSLRDFSTGGTILSGDFQKDNDANNNAYNVIRNYPEDDEIISIGNVLDGVIIRDGIANQLNGGYLDHVKSSGGGILTIGASLTLRNSYLVSNFAYEGGGIYSHNNYNSINNTYFIANQSAYAGSAICNDNALLTIKNSAFLLNEDISTNPYQGAGSIFNSYSTFQAHNITVTGNSATAGTGTGGIINEQSNVAISNSILWNNKGNNLQDIATNAQLYYSIIDAWDKSGTGNIFEDPMFVQPPNFDSGILGSISLMPCSPAINKANPSSNSALIGNKDINFFPRIHNTIADIGATEYQGDPMKLTITSTANGKINTGDAVTLTAAGADSYLWSTTDSTSSIVVNPLYDSTFVVQGSISSGFNICMLEDSVTLLINPLPVRLISFAVQPHLNTTVKIEWATTDELNNDYFELERSTNLVDTEVVTRIPATSSNHKGLHQYIQIDESPYKGRSYYRLVQVDKDGTTTRYDWKSVVLNQEYMVYPNPVTTSIFSVQVDEDQNVQLRMTNIEGTNIPFTTHRVNGKVQIQLPKGITPGIYQLKVQERGQSIVHKVVVQ